MRQTKLWMLGAALAAGFTALTATPASAGTQITGRWHGYYKCGEISEAWLELHQDGRQIWGTFRFRTESGISGSYRVSGWKSMVGEFSLIGDEWIDQPEGFRMVGLKGEVTINGKRMDGIVNDTACENFYFDRAD